MKVIILAGGKGERLRPLTKKTPKPMILVHNKPIVEYSIAIFKKYGLTDIIFSLCYLPDIIKKYFGTGKKFGIHTSYIIEQSKKPMGTAGSLAAIKNELSETFIVCSGDIIHNFNIRNIIKFHKNKGGIATICVYNNKRPNPKSFITIDKHDKITAFVERPKNITKRIIWSNASLYIFEPEVLSYIPKDKPSDFGKDIFPKLLKKGKKMFAYKETGYFLDIGTEEKIKIAEHDIKNGKLSNK